MDDVYDFIRYDIGIEDNDTIVAGVSGGPDSMALIHILNDLKEELNIKIICAHINHNKREESKKELEALEAYC